MKNILAISAFLLIAGGVYGVIEYKKQQEKGALETLYKDETYNAKPPEKPAAKDKVKELDVEEFSRAAIVEDEMPVAKTRKSNSKKTTTEVVEVVPAAVNEKADEVYSSKSSPGKKMVAEKEEEVILEVVPEKIDTAQAAVAEKKEVRLAAFSRAPIRKKQVRSTADEKLKTDSLASRQ
jgi:hypothetical protein